MTRNWLISSPGPAARQPVRRVRPLRLEALEDRTVPDGTFTLHSRPTASKVIYLDFDGQTTTGTVWNDHNNPIIVTPAFDLDGDPTTFTPEELARIEAIWQRVAEDFSPFDVDVTTEDPGVERLRNTGGTDTQWGIRAIIGGDGTWWGPVGGISYIGSFDWDNDNGCFIFSKNLTGDEKYTAEGISHEVGHTLGLHHDGQFDPPNDPIEHYGGHGTGPTGWAPIMGVSYFRELTQWSNGTYPRANNHEDDLAIISSAKNGFGYRPDDHGNTILTATRATVDGPTSISGSGVIEKRTDVDYFRFVAGSGQVTITVDPAARGGNLDIRADLYDATGHRITFDNPPDGTSATIVATLQAGKYFLKIDGVGKGDPLDEVNPGYSDYGSLGQYTITGTIAEPIPLRVTGVAPIESATGLVSRLRVTFNVAPNPATFASGKVRVTGPAGAAVAILGLQKVDPAGTVWDVLITPQKFAGYGGVRLWISPNVLTTGVMPMDQDQDGAAGEPEDYLGAAAYQFNSSSAGLIADNATTDFPITVGRSLPIADVNVRVNLTHPYISDLEIDLISPSNKVVKLFDHRGADGNDLRDTRFDDQAAKTLDLSIPPYAGVFRPDGGALADLIGDDAQGTWMLRIIDGFAGAAGQLNSWGLTVTTSAARSAAGLVAVDPVNETGSSVATLVSSLQLVFAGPMNPTTVTPADVRVVDPRGFLVPVFTVVPAAGTNNTQFLVTTAPWVRAGNYSVRIGPAVTDIYGNSLDTNGNGAFLEANDKVILTKTIDNHVFLSHNPPLVIPRGGSVTTAITIGSTAKIGDLAIELNIQHPSVGDLKVILIAPNGDQFVLVDHVGGAGANFVRTVLSDAATTPIGDGTAPFRGDFQPSQSLAALAGRAMTGTWKLRVEDTGTGDAGSLLSWGLYVKPQ
jgi:subtilisin-like proprotein convertase family protein